MIGADSLEAEVRRFRSGSGVAAVVAGVVGVAGNSLTSVAGTVSRESHDAASVADTWHIGSCGKAMTASVYATLVEAGEAGWDTSIGELLADLDPHPEWRDRTMAEALVCVAGIPANPSPAEMLASYSDDRPPADERAELVARTLSQPPTKPGRFVYSNLGYVVVGAVIDRLAGVPFEEALVERVFRPLGMRSADFGPPPRIRGHHPRFRLPIIMVGRGEAAPPDEAGSDNPPIITPAGRFHMNLADWGRFQHMILSGGGDLLRNETVDRMLTVNGKMAMGWARARFDGFSIGMQGSNTMWSATVLLADDRSAAAMVVANDGRNLTLSRSLRFAHRLLTA
ncbi:MAG: serine hydrolase domain-containing protein [Acidimicrobiia bacterium]